jgi:hypothetical protein
MRRRAHNAPWFIDYDEFLLAVDMHHLDWNGRDRGFMAMDNIFNSIPILDYGPDFCGLSIDAAHARLYGISLGRRECRSLRRSHFTHIILYRAIPKFG